MKTSSVCYLLISNGEIIEETLEDIGYDEDWLKKQLKDLGYLDIEKVFCAECTPKRGFYIIDMDGQIMDKNKEEEVEDISEKLED